MYKENRQKDKRTPKVWWSDLSTKHEKKDGAKNFNRIFSQENLLEFKRMAALFQTKREEIRKKIHRQTHLQAGKQSAF